MEKYIIENEQVISIDGQDILLEKGDIIISHNNNNIIDEETDNKKDYPEDSTYMYVLNVRNKNKSDSEFKPHGSPYNNEQQAKDKKSELEHDLDNRDKEYQIQKLKK